MQKKIKRGTVANIILTSVTLVSFFVLLFLVANSHHFKIDILNIIVAENRVGFLNNFFKIFTYLGSFYVLAIISVLVFLVLYFVFKQKLLALSFLSCFTCTSILNLILKNIVQRPRPQNLMIIEEMGFAFPSGHAMMSLAVFGFFVYFAFKFIKNKTLSICLIALFVTITLLVGFSRIYLGVHYVSDVIAGWLVAYPIIVCCVWLTNYLKFKHTKNIKEKQ